MARIPRRLAGIGASDLADAAAFDAYVGPAREITVDQQRGIIALHDGVTPGGQQFHAGGGDGDTAIDPIPKSFAGIVGDNQTYSLDLVPATAGNVLVYVGGIRQVPNVDYTVSGATLTILTNPDGLEVDTLLLAGPYSLTFIQNGSITEEKLADEAVTEAKLADGVVTLSKLDDEVQEAIGIYVQLETGADATQTLAAFQAAIDALPSTGGEIIVPPGDYSALVPTSLTIATNKMVNWIAYDATLPSGMPGAVVVSGFRNQPNENSAGTGTRPGAAFQRIIAGKHTPDVTVQNQQDSILYLEGASPAVDGNLAQEFAALRFNMGSEMYDSSVPAGTPSNLDIKGVQGVVRGKGGNSKIRSLRTTSVATDGHYGLVTGGMFAAHRSGVIPTQAPFNGNGTAQWTNGVAGPYMSGDAAIIAQIGPGIQANIRMEGFAAAERPQYGLLQARGNAAILPEIAVISLHGGGNGRMIQGVENENGGAEIFAVSKTGGTKTTAAMSGSAIVADDATTGNITPPVGSGMIFVHAFSASNAYVGAFFRVGASPFCQSMFEGSLASTSTADLTGTTGIDGELTVSAKADGTIEIENRTGASRTIVWFFVANV